MGKIVALAALIDCSKITAAPEGNEGAFGNYEPGRYAWDLSAVVAVPEPIPCRGSLGLWTPPPDVLRKLAEAVHA